MNTAREVQQALLQAVTQAGLRAFDDPGGLISPPGVVIGPPTLDYAVYASSDPTDAQFGIFLVVEADERASDRLHELLPRVIEAVEAAGVEAAVRRAEPGTFLTGNTNLPCYIIRTEVAL